MRLYSGRRILPRNFSVIASRGLTIEYMNEGGGWSDADVRVNGDAWSMDAGRTAYAAGLP
jgi:hypothetical protein